MDRSHSFSRPSPTNGKPRSPSPRSTTTPRTTTMPSRGRPSEPRSSSSHDNSHSRSSSRSSSRSPSRRRHHHQHHHHQPQHEHHHGLFKTSASLLAGIGLATVLAHKVWPKGVLHGDEEEWTTRPKSKHHHHHHHHSSERHEHHHRRSSDADRMLDRAKSTHPGGDIMYVEEEGPFRRGDARRMSLDPRALDRIEDERVHWEANSPRARPAVLPYPETPYPNEKFYEPMRMRGPIPAPIPVSR
ncbi:hypothetical protein B0J13DRAFT_555078 [Dactylonectria estremocensis]|uniref:Uncharacterized protein n=1 Tax=Dactylonectria estremocensis TaxID=1079267 RepID=A0A9P9J6F3_9HYPO|nr:hypothetical protein B0J13DRAFT_555078 [Dactylonectria estremocensis]